MPTKLADFNPSENNLLRCCTFEHLADYRWDSEEKNGVPEQGVIFCHCDNIRELFATLERNKGNGRKYFVFSAESDYGICYQKDSPPWNDFLKWIHFCPLDQLGYNPLMLAPRCFPDQCKVEDKFSVKMYSWTKGTFGGVPASVVRWLTTNCSIQEPSVVGVPFGVPDWSVPHILANRDNEKKKLLYVNFSVNTIERRDLLADLETDEFITVQRETVSHAQYFEELSRHKFVLSPPGNGMDCYRTWEAIYTRSVPIVLGTRSNSWFRHLPLLHVGPKFNYHDYQLLEETHKQISEMEFDFSYLIGQFWADLIDNYRNSLKS